MLNSLQNKIRVAIASILLIFVLILSVLLYEMSYYENNFENVKNNSFTASNQVRLAQSIFKTQVQEWKNVLIRGHNIEDREKYWQRFLASETTFVDAISNVGINNSAMNKLANDTKSLYIQVLKDYKQGYQIYNNSNFDVPKSDSFVRGIDRPISINLDKLVKLIDDEIEVEFKRLNSRTQRTKLISSILLLAFAVIVSSLISSFLKKSIVTPTVRLSELLKGLSEGDYSINIDYKSNDEIGQLINSAKILKEKLSDSVGNINLVNYEVNAAFSKLIEVSQEIDSSSNTQNKVVEHLNQAVSLLSEMADNNKTDSEQAFEACESTSHSASQCTNTLDKANIDMCGLVDEMRAISEQIVKLESESSEINNVLQVIQSIAEQTNLLALNAAIEAARAGEQGRGFAVVADEVRSLANRTQNSTLEIKEIIDGTVQGSKDAVTAIQAGLDKTLITAQSVGEASKILAEISYSFTKLNNVIHSVDENANKQKSVASDIVTQVEKMVTISDNLKAMSESDEVSVAVNKASKDLQQLVDTLVTQKGEDELF